MRCNVVIDGFNHNFNRIALFSDFFYMIQFDFFFQMKIEYQIG